MASTCIFGSRGERRRRYSEFALHISQQQVTRSKGGSVTWPSLSHNFWGHTCGAEGQKDPLLSLRSECSALLLVLSSPFSAAEFSSGEVEVRGKE